jgi:2-polyprenyl-3-methyl-5-hydroxy-6-metoxy-1,4-benzoquinol methylase
MARRVDDVPRWRTLRCRYGKDLDVRRLKDAVLNDPEACLGQICKRRALFETPENLTEVRRCYICGGGQFQDAVRIWDAQYVQCQGCTHVFLIKRLTDEAMREFYRTDETYAATYADRTVSPYRKSSVAAPKVEYVMGFLSPREGRIRWLDVGSASGETVSVLIDKGVDVVGLELSERSCAFAYDQYGIRLLRKTLAEYASENTEKFHVISMIGVLEHMSDPMDALRVARGLLYEGGILAVQVPNFESFSTRVQSAFPDQVIRHAEPVGHMMLFTPRSLERALVLSRFEPQGIWFFGMDFHELLFHLSLQDVAFRQHPIRQQLYDHLNDLQAIIDRAGLSDGMLMVGEGR